MVVVAIWALVALFIGLYILFVVWRLRVERRKKAPLLDTGSTGSSVSSVIARAAESGLPRDVPLPPTSRVAEARPSPAGSASSAASPGALSVAEALSGISLPNDLAPLTTMAPREGVADRVAFWSAVPVEVVGPAFGDELERLGYIVSPLDETTLAAQRGNTRLVAIIHPDGHRATIGQARAFESVPELATVIEVWIPV